MLCDLCSDGMDILNKARWRGSVTRHKMRRHAEAVFLKADQKETPDYEDTYYCGNTSGKTSRKGKQLNSAEHVERRCPERAAWEQSWARVCLKRASFRDRVRVWQAIVGLKRSGGRGRMGITNNEAWTALCDASGSTSVAATLLSSEEYLLGRRLQEQVREVPPYLSLDRASFSPSSTASSNPRQGNNTLFSVRGRSSSAGKKRIQCQTPTEQGTGDIFECASAIFYNAPKTRTTTPKQGRKKAPCPR